MSANFLASVRVCATHGRNILHLRDRTTTQRGRTSPSGVVIPIGNEYSPKSTHSDRSVSGPYSDGRTVAVVVSFMILQKCATSISWPDELLASSPSGVLPSAMCFCGV